MHIIQYRVVNEQDEYNNDSRRVHVTVKLPRVAKPQAVALLRDRFDKGGCGHAHDCCGCTFGGVLSYTVRNTKRHEWTATLSYSINC